jgi:hypothetical protein
VQVFDVQVLEHRTPARRIGRYLVLQGSKCGLDVALAPLRPIV